MISEYGAIESNTDDQEKNNDLESNTDSENINDKKINFNKIIGVLLSISAGILFSANNFMINQLNIVVSDAVVVRCILQIIIYGAIIYISGDRFLPEDNRKKVYTLIQGLAGSVAFITSLASVSFMPVPDALCIIFARPVVTILLSALILKDRLNIYKCFSGLLLLVGVTLVCKPPFLFNALIPDESEVTDNGAMYFVGVYLALTACGTNGLMDVIIAKCEGVSTTVLVNWLAIPGLVIAVIYTQFDARSCILSANIVNISAYDWFILLATAVIGLLASITMCQAIKMISPAIVAALSTLELPLAYVVQTLLSGQVPDMFSCLGGGLILSGVLILSFHHKLPCFRSRQNAEEYTRLLD